MKEYVMDCHLRINEYSDITKLAKTLYSWLGENYRMLYKKEVSLPWLSLPQLEQNIVKAKDSSTLDPQKKLNQEMKVKKSSIELE